jgi:hypothetical protein
MYSSSTGDQLFKAPFFVIKACKMVAMMAASAFAVRFMDSGVLSAIVRPRDKGFEY